MATNGVGGNENLKLWDEVEDTDATYCKQVAFGKRRFTAIDATYQRKRATELWGPYGGKWGLKNIRWGYVGKNEIKMEDGLQETPAELWVEAVFYCPYGEFECSSDIGWSRGGECRKKLLTDLMKKCLSYLGFSADVYQGRFDDERYQEVDSRADVAEKAIHAIKEAPDLETLDRYYRAARERNMNKFWMNMIVNAYRARKTELEYVQD